METTTLDKLPLGQEAIIAKVGGEGSILRRRLLDMGLTPRTRVMVRKRAPLGSGSWQATTSLICGITAKEVVISTLSVLAVGSGGAPDLASLFSPLTAYTFLVFCLLYPPCVAALATIRRELNSDTSTLCLMGYELVVAWCVAFIVRQIGLMLGFA